MRSPPSIGRCFDRLHQLILRTHPEAHISPAHSENINFFGAIEVDIEGELAELGLTGYRPLRVRDTLF